VACGATLHGAGRRCERAERHLYCDYSIRKAERRGMARVTVEDCVLKVPNRFELVLLAAQRSRDIAAGGTLTVDRDNDKNPVVALREIADESVPLDNLQNALIKGMQKHVEIDEPEEDREFAAEGVWPADLAAPPAMAEEDGEPASDEE